MTGDDRAFWVKVWAGRVLFWGGLVAIGFALGWCTLPKWWP